MVEIEASSGGSAGLKRRLARAIEWRTRRFLLRLIERPLAAASAERLRDFERARQLRATFDSLDYAERHMREAAVCTDRRRVMALALDHAPPEGLYLEFGVWSGRSINFIAERHGGTIHGFDSFAGLPEDWTGQYRRGAFDTGGALPRVRPNVRLHVGWFEQTLPDFVHRHDGPVSFMHVDCDLYSSTRTVFSFLGERLVPGSIIVFDEYFNFPGWRDHEFKAFQELVAERRLAYRYLAYNERWHQAAVVIA